MYILIIGGFFFEGVRILEIQSKMESNLNGILRIIWREF